MSIREKMWSEEFENRRRTGAELGPQEVALEILAETALHALIKFEKCRRRVEGDLVFLLLGVRAREDMVGAWSQVASGHYGPANTLLRATYEGWIAQEYFRRYPLEAPQWWLGDGTAEEQRAFRPGRLRDRLITDGVVEPEERTAYSTLSEMAHPTAGSVLAYVRPGRIDEKKGFHVGPVPDFNLRIARYLLSSAILLGIRQVRTLIGAIREHGGDTPDEQWNSDTFLETAAKIEESLRISPKLLLANPELVYDTTRLPGANACSLVPRPLGSMPAGEGLVGWIGLHPTTGDPVVILAPATIRTLNVRRTPA
jgi:hypothetical protein